MGMPSDGDSAMRSACLAAGIGFAKDPSWKPPRNSRMPNCRLGGWAIATKYRVERDLAGAFELTPESLLAFEPLLKRELDVQPQCVLKLDMGRRSEIENVDEMLEESFLHNSRIESISLSAEAASLSATVEFSRSFLRPVSIRLSGKQSAVLALETKLMSLVERPRRWDSFLLAPFGWHIPMAMLVYVACLAALAFIAFGTGVAADGGTPNARIMLTTAGVLAAGMGWMLLPSMVFAIGRGQRRWSFVQRVFSYLFVSCGTAAAINWGTALWSPMSP